MDLNTSYPLSSINFFAAGTLLEHSTEVFPYEIFRNCETNFIRQALVTLPHSPPILILNCFGFKKFCETQKGSPMKFFGTLRNKLFFENGDISLLDTQFFDTGNVLKNRRVPRRFFLELRVTNFRRKNLVLPPPHPRIHKLFGYWKFSETQHRMSFLRIFSEL